MTLLPIFNIEDYPLQLIAMNSFKKKTLNSRLFLLFIFFALCAFLPYLKLISLCDFDNIVQPPVVYRHRNSIVNTVCSQKHYVNVSLPLDRKVAAQLYVEHSHKFIYCAVQKVGSSNWKRVILALNGLMEHTINELSRYEVHSSPLLFRLSSYSQAKQKELLSNYTKVMFTRNPLERVVSAYRDKFLHDDVKYIKTLAETIRTMLGIKHNPADIITFEEFVRYIFVEDPENRNPHWKPMYQLCDPCKIPYDIIGKYETLTQDANFVLNIIRAPENVTYPSMKLYSNESRTNEEITRQYLETLPPNLFRQLMNFYSVDFSMFEYDHYKVLQPETFEMK